ncbi:hypothetical protein AXE65_02325 [Ventosimonas gracilis]|uniref:Uncharacterized protein n=1 Tax=Ventosimonas gracilis TaxID=1680762 RepID=A0A139SUG3_9GAMM|nr:hypothetical protein [Ventosimonas gracilis]KXU38248.1 hypothetical protein AXE65_02325 [Ventosimonas gracilis]
MSCLTSQRFRLHIHFDNESQTFWANSPDINGLAVSGEDLQEVQREAFLAAETLFEIDAVQGTNTAICLVTSPNLPNWHCVVKDKEIIISTFFDCIHATDDTESNKKELSAKIEKVRDAVLAAIANLNEVKEINISIGKDIVVLGNHTKTSAYKYQRRNSNS